MSQSAIGVTGIGVLTALGHGLGEHWEALATGRDGHQALPGLGPACPRPLAAALLTPSQWAQVREMAPAVDPAVALAAVVARDALAQAGGGLAGLGLVVGTSNGSLHSRRDSRLSDVAPGTRLALLRRSAVDQTAPELAAVLGLTGPSVTVSTACASSTHALGLALGWLRSGRLERVLVVGVDVVLPLVAAGFDALGVLADGPCAPFSTPFGMSLGEGAAAWVLERDPSVAPPQAWLRGYGCSADAVHPTAPDPTGRGIARSIAAALSDAGVAPSAVDLYSAQGTGTEANDAAETLAVRQALGEAVPVTSAKGHLGHCQGAGGLLEASLVIAGMAAGQLPPTAHYLGPRRLAPPDVVHGLPRPGRLEVAVKHSAAFGGANASVVLGRAPGPPSQAPTLRRWGIVGIAALRGLPDGAAPVTPTRVGRVRLGTLDPTGRLLVAAVAAALPPNHDEHWGLIAGAPGLQAAAGTAWQDSIRRRAASGRSFSRLVRNAGTGAACLALGLRGPTSTLCAGPATGLLALLHGLDLLARTPAAPGLVIAGADEVGPNTRDCHALDPTRREAPVDAAAAVALAPESGPLILGTGLAGSDGLGHAITQALSEASATVQQVWSASDGSAEQEDALARGLAAAGLAALPHVRCVAGLGSAEATDALVALGEAAAGVSAGQVSRALVIARSPRGASVAVVLGTGG